jgi:hypothetical protein
MLVVFDSVDPAAVEVVAAAFVLTFMKPLLTLHAMAGAVAVPVPVAIMVGGESQTGEDH